jgi:hypothetical protein
VKAAEYTKVHSNQRYLARRSLLKERKRKFKGLTHNYKIHPSGAKAVRGNVVPVELKKDAEVHAERVNIHRARAARVADLWSPEGKSKAYRRTLKMLADSSAQHHASIEPIWRKFKRTGKVPSVTLEQLDAYDHSTINARDYDRLRQVVANTLVVPKRDRGAGKKSREAKARVGRGGRNATRSERKATQLRSNKDVKQPGPGESGCGASKIRKTQVRDDHCMLCGWPVRRCGKWFKHVTGADIDVYQEFVRCELMRLKGVKLSRHDTDLKGFVASFVMLEPEARFRLRSDDDKRALLSDEIVRYTEFIDADAEETAAEQAAAATVVKPSEAVVRVPSAKRDDSTQLDLAKDLVAPILDPRTDRDAWLAKIDELIAAPDAPPKTTPVPPATTTTTTTVSVPSVTAPKTVAAGPAAAVPVVAAHKPIVQITKKDPGVVVGGDALCMAKPVVKITRKEPSVAPPVVDGDLAVAACESDQAVPPGEWDGEHFVERPVSRLEHGFRSLMSFVVSTALMGYADIATPSDRFWWYATLLFRLPGQFCRRVAKWWSGGGDGDVPPGPYLDGARVKTGFVDGFWEVVRTSLAVAPKSGDHRIVQDRSINLLDEPMAVGRVCLTGRVEPFVVPFKLVGVLLSLVGYMVVAHGFYPAIASALIYDIRLLEVQIGVAISGSGVFLGLVLGYYRPEGVRVYVDGPALRWIVSCAVPVGLFLVVQNYLSGVLIVLAAGGYWALIITRAREKLSYDYVPHVLTSVLSDMNMSPSVVDLETNFPARFRRNASGLPIPDRDYLALRAGTYEAAKMYVHNDDLGFQLRHASSSLGDRLFGAS